MHRAGPPPDTALQPEAIAALLKGRRTVDRFLPEAPPEHVIEAALQAACWAPNHRLTEPWRFYLLGEQTAAAIVELNARRIGETKGAEAADLKRRKWSGIPGWFVLSCVKADDTLQAREDYAACCCAAQNIMLSLWASGVGSKWTTGAVTRDPAFQELLGIRPAEEEVVGLFWYGYPAGAPRSMRRDAAGFTSRLP